MIKEVTMYTVICDNCGADSGENADHSCWHDGSQARDTAIDSEWQTEDDENNNEKHYCPQCVIEVGDDDKIVIDKTRTKVVVTEIP